MIIECKNCKKNFPINDSVIKGRYVRFYCPYCNFAIEIDLRPKEKESDSVTFEEKKTEITRIIHKIDDLPTLPMVINRILKLVNDPKSTVRQIGNIINSDQSLTAKTLRLVNSAFYGYEKKIKTVDQAIVIIGFEAVKNLAISATVFDIFKGMKQKSSFDRQGFWTHSIATAFIAKELSEDTRLGNSGEVFVGALLHDIGKVVLDVYFPDDMNKILYHSANNNLSFYKAEEEVNNINHARIGYYIGKRWNLPDELILPIHYHHNPQATPKFNETVSISHISNIIAKIGKLGYDGDSAIPKISIFAWNIIKKRKPDLSKETIQYYIDKAQQKLNESNFVDLALS